MIRINLLAADRPVKGPGRKAAAPGEVQAYLFLALFAGGALLLCGGLWWFKEDALKKLDASLASATQRRQELQKIEDQVNELEKRRKTHLDKVNLIETLKARQAGPVHMLDEISKSLPDFVWLNSMEDRGNTINFAGESATLTAVADFITNLQNAGDECGRPNPDDRSRCWFPDVTLIDSRKGTGPTVSFRLMATFKSLSPPAKEGAGVAAGPGPQG
jgi:type IV pilus assembly protein PilN